MTVGIESSQPTIHVVRKAIISLVLNYEQSESAIAAASAIFRLPWRGEIEFGASNTGRKVISSLASQKYIALNRTPGWREIRLALLNRSNLSSHTRLSEMVLSWGPNSTDSVHIVRVEARACSREAQPQFESCADQS
jgi:hypothetical protein